MKEVKNRKR